MRCSNRLITSSARSLVGAVVVFSVPALTWTASAQVTEVAGDQEVVDAISAAVRERVGATASVQVTVEKAELREASDATVPLVAQPPPGARLGRPVRYALYRPTGVGSARSRRRVGYAIAEARVSMTHARAARPLSRGEVVEATDVVVADTDVGEIRMAPLPDVASMVGSSVVRQIRAGELLSASVIRPPVLVRPGESVVTKVAVGAVSVTGVAVARQVGRLGDLITLVNEESGRRLHGRVVALQEVEVEP